MRDELIEFAMSRHGPNARDAHAVADATVRAVDAVLDALKPLVGDMATRALYFRSLHLANLSVPRRVLPDHRAQSALFEELRAEIAACEMQEASRVSRLLLQSIADLLASLIGDNLTDRMLRTAWGIPAPQSRPEDTST